MSEVAPVLIGFERQGLQRSDQRGLFAGRQDLGPIVEPRHDRLGRTRRAEQIDLVRGRHDKASRSAPPPAVPRLDTLTPTRRTPRLGG